MTVVHDDSEATAAVVPGRRHRARRRASSRRPVRSRARPALGRAAMGPRALGGRDEWGDSPGWRRRRCPAIASWSRPAPRPSAIDAGTGEPSCGGRRASMIRGPPTRTSSACSRRSRLGRAAIGDRGRSTSSPVPQCRRCPGRESYGDRLAVGDGGAFVLDPDDEKARHRLRPRDGCGALDRRHRSVSRSTAGRAGRRGGHALGRDARRRGRRDGTVRWAWEEPLGTEWMNALDANATTIFVAVNSLPFGD